MRCRLQSEQRRQASGHDSYHVSSPHVAPLPIAQGMNDCNRRSPTPHAACSPPSERRFSLSHGLVAATPPPSHHLGTDASRTLCSSRFVSVATSSCASNSGRDSREAPRPPTEATVTLRGDEVPGTNSCNSGLHATVVQEDEPMLGLATPGRRIPRHNRSARRVRGGRPFRGGRLLATFVHSEVTSQSAQQHLRKKRP